MGYTTEFEGAFTLSRPLTVPEASYLKAFAETRRVKRTLEIVTFPDPLRIATCLPAGPEGAYYVGGDENAAIADDNAPPEGQPGLYCQWVPTSDGLGIEWDGNEKFYHYQEWMDYLVSAVLGRWGIDASGSVRFQGEEWDDRGTLVIRDGHCVLGDSPALAGSAASPEPLALDGRTALYDITQRVPLTADYVDAIKALLRAEIAMMRQAWPEFADSWTWGWCKVLDIASSGGLQMTFGGEDDHPEDLPPGEDVLVVVRQGHLPARLERSES